MIQPKLKQAVAGLALSLSLTSTATAQNGGGLSDAVKADYQNHLEPLFIHFHKNPELSLLEFETAKRLAQELRDAGFRVTEGIAGTGVVAILRNGDGPTVMVRADMDGVTGARKKWFRVRLGGDAGGAEWSGSTGYARLWSRCTYHQFGGYRALHGES